MLVLAIRLSYFLSNNTMVPNTTTTTIILTTTNDNVDMKQIRWLWVTRQQRPVTVSNTSPQGTYSVDTACVGIGE